MMEQYNSLRLLQINEFDAHMQSRKQGCKEAFYSNLSIFVHMSDVIIKKYDLYALSKGNFHSKQHEKDMSKLQTLLAGIGAEELEKELRTLKSYQNDSQYADKLGSLFSSVELLRKKVISAAQAPEPLPGESDAESDDTVETAAAGEAREVQRDKFERLLMLIESFEYENAIFLLQSIMQYSYTPEIDSLLKHILSAINDFNYDLALKSASTLMKEILSVEKAKKRILIVDDVPEVIRIVKALLKDQYTVIGIRNYASTIRFLTGNNADLILLDIDMPDIDGFSLLQLIRKFPNYEKIPAIFLTGNATSENVRTALSLGATDFIIKPVDGQTLLEKLGKALEAGDK